MIAPREEIKARSRWRGQTTRAGVPLLVFLSPAIALTGLVVAYPLVGIVFSSFRVDGAFAGLDNYRAIFDDPVFWQSFRNNLVLLVSIPLRILVALVITAVLFKRIFGSRLYEILVFLPFIPSIAAIGVLFVYLLNIDGPLNGALRAVGLGGLAHGWLTDPGYPMWAIMGVVAWTRIGFTVLLFLARLLSVDREVFQAAFLDGASWTQTFRKLAIPELKGTLEFVVVLGVIEAFSWSFAYVYVLSQGSRDTSNFILEIYLYNQEFLNALPGLAAATGVFIFAIAGSLAVYRYWRIRTEIA